MNLKGIWKGTSKFPDLADYIPDGTVVLNILSIEASGNIEAEFTEESFADGLSGLSRRTGSRTWKLAGGSHSRQRTLELKNVQEEPNSGEEIQLQLTLSPDNRSLTGEYYKNGIGPAELELLRI